MKLDDSGNKEKGMKQTFAKEKLEKYTKNDAIFVERKRQGHEKCNRVRGILLHSWRGCARAGQSIPVPFHPSIRLVLFRRVPSDGDMDGLRWRIDPSRVTPRRYDLASRRSLSVGCTARQVHKFFRRLVLYRDHVESVHSRGTMRVIRNTRASVLTR